MAEVKSSEREYTIPLRRVWLKAPEYERGRKAIKAIKEFIAKHMKVPDRNIDKVKLDIYLNNELWFRGRRHPPAKVKVRVVKENDLVKVGFAEIPEYVRFSKAKIDKIHKKEKKKEEAKPEKKDEAKVETKPSEEEKKEEKEKEIAVAEQHAKEAKLDAKAQKHLSKKKEESYHRMALKK